MDVERVREEKERKQSPEKSGKKFSTAVEPNDWERGVKWPGRLQ